MDFTHIWPSFFQVTQLDSWSPQNGGHLDLTLAKGHLDKTSKHPFIGHSWVTFWDLGFSQETSKNGKGKIHDTRPMLEDSVV